MVGCCEWIANASRMLGVAMKLAKVTAES